MGIFHEQIEVVNRTSRKLNVRYDGQDIEIEPNYDEAGNRLEGVVNFIPKITMAYALAQNPVMGSESSVDPSSFRSMLGFVDRKVAPGARKSWHDTSFFDERAWVEEKGTDALTRVPLSEMLEDDPQVQSVKVRGRRQDLESQSRTPFELKVN